MLVPIPLSPSPSQGAQSTGWCWQHVEWVFPPPPNLETSCTHMLSCVSARWLWSLSSWQLLFYHQYLFLSMYGNHAYTGVKGTCRQKAPQRGSHSQLEVLWYAGCFLSAWQDLWPVWEEGFLIGKRPPSDWPVANTQSVTDVEEASSLWLVPLLGRRSKMV